ncbi:MAG: hypothetical protein M3081_05940 [Gemmatimonadota bacterium]|nr:hypothetical protein [Gemmatimonadota bacterium]
MRLAHLLVALGVSRSPAAADNPALRFADILWGDPVAVAKEKLKSNGYVVEGMQGNDLTFRGRFHGYDGRGMIYLADGRVVRTFFSIEPPPAQALVTFDRIRKDLLRQLGPATFNVEHYNAPYVKGDGREVEALQQGQLRVALAWQAGKNPDEGGCFVEMGKDLTLFVVYEGPKWHAERLRRKKAKEGS